MWKRETKLGLVVSGSFLCLLGALVGRKLLISSPPPAGDQPAAVAQAAGPPKSAPAKEPAVNKLDEPKPFPISPTSYNEAGPPGGAPKAITPLAPGGDAPR